MLSSRVNIIVPVHNQVQFTKQMIAEIYENTNPATDWHLTVVDNASVDETKDLPWKDMDKVTYIGLEDNYGFAGAVNEGIEFWEDQPCHFLILNNDVQIPKDWIKRLLKHLKDDVAIVGPKTNHSATAQKMALIDHHKWRDVDRDLQLKFKGMNEEARHVTGFCMLVNYKFWKKYGKLDEDTFVLAGEDFDYCIRARQAKMKVLIAKDIFVYHYGHQTAKHLDDDMNFWRLGLVKLKEKWNGQL